VQLPGNGPVPLASSKAVLLTGPQPKAVLTGLVHPLSSGSFVNVTMNFQNAGSVTLSVPVLSQAQYYSTFSPAPAPTPTPSASAAARKHKHGGNAKAKSGATPTPTPSPSTS